MKSISSPCWFALGAVSCAVCFILGGQAPRPDGKPDRLVVDELIVRGSLTAESLTARKSVSVGPGFPNASWFMSADSNSAELSARSRDARSAFDVAVLDIGATVTVDTQGLSRDLLKKDKMLTLAVLDDRFALPDDGHEVVSLKMVNNGRILRMQHDGKDAVVWSDR